MDSPRSPLRSPRGNAYLDDLPFSRALHVAVVRSSLDHGVVRKVDASRALAGPGVRAVVTWPDLRGECGPFPVVDWELAGLKVPACYPLADGEVCFAGQPVAAVVAESRAAAEESTEGVAVEYDPLAAVLDPLASRANPSPRVHSSLEDNVAFRWSHETGSPAEAFSRAERVFRRRIVVPRQAGDPLEPRGAVARYDPASGELTLWSSTTVPHLLRVELGKALGIPLSRVRVVAPEIGGCFGTKSHAYPEEALVAVLARRFAPRPVRWIQGALERSMTDVQVAAQIIDLSLATRADGRFLALRYEGVVDLGAYLTLLPTFSPSRVSRQLATPYDLRAVEGSIDGIFTHRVPAHLAGRGESLMAFAVERMVDVVAAELELDPVELRRLNLRGHSPDGGEPAGEPLGRGDVSAVLALALERSRVAELRDEVRARRRRGELVGLGVSVPSETCGPGSPGVDGRAARESARVSVNEDGSVDVFSSVATAGPCVDDGLRLIAAETLGVEPRWIRVHRGDTKACPSGAGAPEGGGLAVGGKAVAAAAVVVGARMRKIAAALFGIAEDYVQRRGDGFVVDSEAVSFAEVCAHAYRAASRDPEEEPGLEASATAEVEEPLDAASAYLAVVSVDPDTGEVHAERVAGAFDFGRVVDPAALEDRVKGAIVRGASRALVDPTAGLEEPVGLAADSAWTAPTSEPKVNVWLLPRREGGHGGRIRGVGSTGESGAYAAVANAVVDAIRERGISHLDSPLTREKVWAALQGARSVADMEGGER